jgi:beta-lactamase regulating signal transducer with metallopeptidase domain
MQPFWEVVASNALLVVVLAAGVALLGRVWKNPLCLHLLWVLVLLKLVTPPAVTVPLPLPAQQAPLASEEQAASQHPAHPSRVEASRGEAASSMASRDDLSFPEDRLLPESSAPELDAALVTQYQGIPWLAVLAWIWSVGIVFFASIRAYRIFRFSRLLRHGEAPSSAVLSMAEGLAKRLGLRQVPPIRLLPVCISPLVWSLRGRPRVFLPAALFERLDEAAQEAILAHELAHVRRKDHWVRLLEVLITTLFWWHPVVWWAARQLQELEDQCCDGMVVDMTPHSAKSYATALLDTLDFLSDRSVPAPLGATAAKSSVSLARRITMLKNRSGAVRLTFGRLMLLLVVAALPMALAFGQKPPQPATSAPAAKPAPAKTEDAELQQSARNLRDIMSAMHTYHQVAGHFPAARYGWGYDRKTREWFRQRPCLSWRVLLLPMLGQQELFTKFKTGEPWDSEHNRKLIPLMPRIYRAPGSRAGEGKTNYLGVVGSNAAFPEKGTIMVQDFTDGTSNTIMLVEVPDQVAVEWTRPEDFPIDTTEPVKKLVGLRKGGFLTAFAEGSSQFISENIAPKTLRLLLIRNDRELVSEVDRKAWVHSIRPVAAASSQSTEQARTTVEIEPHGGEITGKAIGQRGAQNTSERAVAAALNWLYRHQTPQGNWCIDYRQQCKGEACSGAGLARSDVAATAMALLPFLAAGETPKSKGPYRQSVAKGIDWLIKQQKPSGNLSGGCEQPMYAHGLAMIALCETYGMTHDEQVGNAARLGVGYIERAQNQVTGGWVSLPSEAGDTSIFGWQIMALKSAQLAGLPVKASVLNSAQRWLRLVAKGEHMGLCSNQPSGDATPAMTAVGMLARQYLGVSPQDPALLEGKSCLSQNLPDNKLARNTCYWYYAVQAMHIFADADYDAWNRKMRRALIETQVKEGCAAGSWDPEKPAADTGNERGGRLVTTSLSALCLEVYYRYLPLFRVTTSLASSQPAEANPEQAKAVAEIEKLGGKVSVDEKSPDKPVIGVDLDSTKVTDTGLEHLRGLTKLQTLNLTRTKVTDAGLEHLKGLTKLQSLNLWNTEVTDAGLEHLEGLTKLRNLDLSGTKVSDAGLVHLKGLSNLQSLDLTDTQVTDAGLEHLQGLTKLLWLNLGATKVTDSGLEHLKALTELQTLGLEETKVTDAGLEHLKALTKLQWLDLRSTKVTDTGLEHLKGLTKVQTLHLNYTEVTDAGLEHLKGLTNLQWLCLGTTKVTDAGVKKLQQALPKCEIYH